MSLWTVGVGEAESEKEFDKRENKKSLSQYKKASQRFQKDPEKTCETIDKGNDLRVTPMTVGCCWIMRCSFSEASTDAFSYLNSMA